MCSDKSEGIPWACHGGSTVFEVYIMNREHLYGGSITYRSVDRGRCPRVFPKLRFYVEISETYFPNWPPLKCLSQNCSRYIFFSKIYSLWLRKSSDRITAAEKQFPVRVLPLSHGNLIMIMRLERLLQPLVRPSSEMLGMSSGSDDVRSPFPPSH